VTPRRSEPPIPAKVWRKLRKAGRRKGRHGFDPNALKRAQR